LAYSRDGSQLAWSGADGQIAVWDINSERLVQSFPSGKDPVHTLAFSPDGKTLFWSDAARLSWRRIADPTVAGAFEMPEICVVEFSPDGHRLLCGGGQGQLLVCAWDGERIVRRGTLTHHATTAKPPWQPIHRAVFSGNGKLVATVGGDKRVCVWEVRGLRMQKEWELRQTVVAAAFALDGRHLVTGNGNSTLAVFRLAPPP
jgi:WD40 repeat protein